jgi:hypothetical protein
MRWLLYLAMVLLYVLHNDLWFWDDATMVLGLPIGLTYHIFYCVVASGMMFLLVKYAWPRGLDVEAE